MKELYVKKTNLGDWAVIGVDGERELEIAWAEEKPVVGLAKIDIDEMARRISEFTGIPIRPS